jgi:hypothetical protein
MRNCLLAALVAFTTGTFAQVAFARGGGHGGSLSSGGSHRVSGYVTKNGTYVAPHMQTNPNSTRGDNWSTKGNTNPYTGQPGTKPLDITPGH